MKWEKQGQIFQVESQHPKLKTHAANPLAVSLKDDIYRVYYSGRDDGNKSSVGYIDIDIVKQAVVNYPDHVAFEYGAADSFYSHGVSIGNMYRQGDKNYILFMAWQIPEGGHWRGDVGQLEVSKDLGTLSLSANNPFMTSDNDDPVSLSYPWVMHHEGIYKMWYGSTVEWDAGNGEMLHVIKYATSEDGENWQKYGQAVPSTLGEAQAFSRPTVLYKQSKYHMWYSYRSGTGQTYRIGYSTSNDGLQWQNNLLNAGIDVSMTGWDSEMICYPYVFEHRGQTYMLYNGNGYGREGFGLAILS